MPVTTGCEVLCRNRHAHVSLRDIRYVLDREEGLCPFFRSRPCRKKEPERIPDALAATSMATAEAASCEPAHVWVTWATIEPGHYVEGGAAAEVQPGATHPPIGRLLCFEGMPVATIEAVLLAAAKTLSRELCIPGNIFIEYVEALSGKVVAGDGLVRKG